MLPHYLTTTHVAQLCQVDSKTIHDWTQRRGMPHMRTPGGHRRFKPREVVPWLLERGYDVPPHLKEAAALNTIFVTAGADALPDATKTRALPEGVSAERPDPVR